ncbi:MAG: ABC transporter substrate-binding protein [Clostridia bacterium]|nr:ABC transporter substrate-binding protein [Clostridia bacterium]
MNSMKKLWKRILCLALSCILLLSACPALAEEEVIEIDFWHHYPSGTGAEIMTEVLADFMEKYPNIKVNELGLGLGEQGEKLVPALVAGTAPDIFVYDLATVQERAMKNQTMCLDEYVKNAGMDMTRYFPATVDICTYDGKLYGMPYMTDTRVLFYNKDHFRAAGLDPEVAPKSWEEVLEYVEKLNITDENGEVTQVGFSTIWWEIAPWTMGWTFGADYWDAENNPTLNTPQMVEALKYVIKLTEAVGADAYQKLFDAAMATGISPFTNGTASMCVQFNGFCSTLATYAPELDYGVALIPTSDGVNNKASWGAGYSLEFTFKDEKRAEAAFLLGQYLTSTEVATKFLLGNSEYVCNMDAYQDPAVQADPVWQVFAESGEYTRIHHFCPELPTWPNSVLLPEWQNALMGAKTPEQAMEDAQKNMLTEIENYRLLNGL